MGKNLLLIGAGASYGARINLDRRNTPPLGKDLTSFLEKKISFSLINKEVRSYRGNIIFSVFQLLQLKYFYTCALVNHLTYEKAVSNLIEKADPRYMRLLDLLNRFIVFSFSSGNKFGGLFSTAFEPRRDLYSDLICKLNISPTEWVVVSLNYDSLFEQALISANKPFEYVGIKAGNHYESGAADAIKIFKIHGSINWYGDIRGSGRLTKSDELPYPVYEDETIYCCKPAQELDEIRHSDKHPLMAHYEPKKGTFRNFQKLQSIREKCLEAATKCSAATIIGMTLPSRDDDKTVYCLVNRIAQSAKTIEYVSPSKEDCDKMQKMFPHIKCSQETLAQWLGVTAQKING